MSRMRPRLSKLVDVIAQDFDLAFARGQVHARPDHIGRPREAQIRRFLSDVLPGRYGVTSGYIAYRCFERGHVVVDVSQEFDIIIYRKDSCPNLFIEEISGSRLIPIDDVYGVIEAKSHLDERRLGEALKKLSQVVEIAVKTRAVSPKGSKRRSTLPFGVVVSYTGAERFGSQQLGFSDLAERIDSNSWGERRPPDAIVVLDRQIVVRGDSAIRRAFMVKTRCTLDETIENQDYQDISSFDCAVSDNRGLSPDYRSFPISKGRSVIALVALLSGLLEEQKLVDYDLGELLSLIQPMDK